VLQGLERDITPASFVLKTCATMRHVLIIVASF
jgi:hypothetical protein